MKYSSVFIIVIASYLPALSQQPDVYVQLEKHYHAGAYEACVKIVKQVEAFAKSRMDTLVANSFFYLGDSYNQTGDLKKALHFF